MLIVVVIIVVYCRNEFLNFLYQKNADYLRNTREPSMVDLVVVARNHWDTPVGVRKADTTLRRYPFVVD